VAHFLVAAGLMWLLAALFPAAAFKFPARQLAAVALLLLAGIVGIAGVRAFARARTTVNPLQPQAASRLVTGGIYRHSRNPMYLALLLALLGWGAWLGNAAALLLIPLFVLAMNRLQIRPEERALESLFGEAFRSYARKVRRWI
jgi:protein-S-isoprenylcysteine O-methyltransferase Ste14